MKFKEGDKVKVRDNCRLEQGQYAGKIGKVVKVRRGLTYSYRVDVDGEALLFLTRELEIINENPKI